MNQGSKIYLARAAETIPNDKVMDAAALTALVAMPAAKTGVTRRFARPVP